MNHSASWRQIGVFVSGEDRFAVLPDRHVDVHSRPVVARIGLGHEGRRLAVGVRHVVDHVLVLLDLVGLLGQRSEDQPELMLRRGDLVVMLVDLHADPLHRREHLRADVLRAVDRGQGEVAALDARTMAHVAHLELGVGVPGRVRRVDLEAHLVHRVREADVVEQEELGFGSEIGRVADAARRQIGFRLLGRPARIAVVGLVGVGLEHRAMQAERLLRVERIDIGGRRIGHQFHVGRFDRLPARDRRAVEHEAFLEEVLIHQFADDRHVLHLAARIGEAEIDVRDVLFLEGLENVVSGAHLGSLDLSCHVSGPARRTGRPAEAALRARRCLPLRCGCGSPARPEGRRSCRRRSCRSWRRTRSPRSPRRPGRPRG